MVDEKDRTSVLLQRVSPAPFYYILDDLSNSFELRKSMCMNGMTAS